MRAFVCFLFLTVKYQFAKCIQLKINSNDDVGQSNNLKLYSVRLNMRSCFKCPIR